MKRRKVLLRILIALLLPAISGVILWNVFSYDNREVLTPVETVTVTERGKVTFFDGPGTDDVLVFYPGAMVEHTAYSALLQRVAEQGVDCCLLKAPLRFALLDVSAADAFLKDHPYAHVYLGGHSLGGVAACMYAADHPDELSGLVLLAAYSSKDLSGTGLHVLSVTGSEDGVINRKKQEEGKNKLPSDAVFVVIEGGNHAQFGTYGDQKKDRPATITAQEQREKTCEAIVGFILREE